MTDLAHRLRESAKATFYDPLKSELNEAASHIEKLEEEVGVLIAASIRLSSRIDLDSDHYADRIEKLEVALRWIVEQERQTAHPTVCAIVKTARKALEGKDG